LEGAAHLSDNVHIFVKDVIYLLCCLFYFLVIIFIHINFLFLLQIFV
jgi:hypothetical protein